MCLMLYIAARTPLRERAMPHGLSVQEVPPDRAVEVSRVLTLPHVRFFGEQGKCSCALPSVICESPFKYYDGMFEAGEGRQAEVNQVRDLLDLVDDALRGSDRVELYPVGSGCEGRSPKGRVDLSASGIKPDEFFFVEQFLHVVTA